MKGILSFLKESPTKEEPPAQSQEWLDEMIDGIFQIPSSDKSCLAHVTVSSFSKIMRISEEEAAKIALELEKCREEND